MAFLGKEHGSFLILQTDNHPHLVHGRTIRDLCPENPAWQVYYTARSVAEKKSLFAQFNGAFWGKLARTFVVLSILSFGL